VHARAVETERVVKRGDGGQRLVVDAQRLQRVGGRRRAVGHDEDDRLARVGDDLLREDLGAHRRHEARVRDEQGQAPQRRHVGRHQHADDARPAPRGVGPHRGDARVSVRAAMNGDVQQAWQRHVGHVAPAARDEPRVLPPPHSRPEQPLGHRRPV
jgi:hypothetical protein